MSVAADTTWNEKGVGMSQQGSEDWIPASAGMTGGVVVSGTGNHKGCPYDGLLGSIFVGMAVAVCVERC